MKRSATGIAAEIRALARKVRGMEITRPEFDDLTLELERLEEMVRACVPRGDR